MSAIIVTSRKKPASAAAARRGSYRSANQMKATRRMNAAVKIANVAASSAQMKRLEPRPVLEPIREVLESDESDVIPCRALDSLLRSARCGHPNTALRRTAVAFVTPVI